MSLLMQSRSDRYLAAETMEPNSNFCIPQKNLVFSRSFAVIAFFLTDIMLEKLSIKKRVRKFYRFPSHREDFLRLVKDARII